MMLSPAFPCLGGAGAVRRGDYRFAVYPPLGSSEAIRVCAADLADFVDGFERGENGVAIHVAVFCGPDCPSELDFEGVLFEHLRGLHDLDGHAGAAAAIDVSDDELGFMFEQRNFFVVGFHPTASRWARRFAWPTLAFNSLSHVDPLQRAGKFERMKERIRARDRRLQGSDNPALECPQAAQFSGRAAQADWRPPPGFD
jgi:FPC/CPF motif-containing protein YcgG